MTAFSRVVLPARGKQWVIEIKSLNQRYFELGMRLPSSLGVYETRVRQLVQGMINRGKISLSVLEEGNGEQKRSYELDEAQVRSYLGASGRLRKKFNLAGDLSAGDLMRLPGVIREKIEAKDDVPSWAEFGRMLKKGIEKAIAHKYEEGRKLEKDLRGRIENIAKTSALIEKMVEDNRVRNYEKLSGRIREIIGDEKMDADRLAREAAFLADRSDITEELVRMRSHLDLFRKWLSGDGEAGREMDFLCQEMMREANTMASKAQLFQVSKEAIAIKSEIEKIREQVQNVE